MNSYGDFAYIYDDLIEQDYGKWADYIEDIFKRYNKKPELVLDLACGTGGLTVELAKRGYDMIGVDLSYDMLNVAMEKSQGLNIQYLCQDMTEFELYGTVDAIVCTLDAINYLTSEKQLSRTFHWVNNYLNPDGLFIFDINTEYKLKTVLGNNKFIYDRGDIFYTWENKYNEKTKISTQNLTFFKSDGDTYSRIDETHRQRAYSYGEIGKILKQNGLILLDKFKVLTFGSPYSKCEKTLFVAKSFR